MKRLIYGISLICAVMITIVATGQQVPQSKGMLIKSEDSFLEPLQKRDSALIGDQFRYGFHLKDVAEGTRFALPDFSKGFMDSVEIVLPFMADTVKVQGKKNEPKSYDIDVSMIITSFDEGKYELLPLSLIRASGVDRIDTLVFASKTLDIFTMPVDTTTYQIHDIKDQIRYPLKAGDNPLCFRNMGGRDRCHSDLGFLRYETEERRKCNPQGSALSGRFAKAGPFPWQQILGTGEAEDVLFRNHGRAEGIY